MKKHFLFICFIFVLMTNSCVIDPETCFTGDTLVRIPEGHVAMSQLQPGSEIVSLDVESGVLVTNTVTHIHTAIVYKTMEVTLEDGTVIHTTDSHPFYDPSLKDYKKMGEFSRGQMLSLYTPEEMKTIEIVKIQAKYGKQEVYHPTVSDDLHNFLVHDVLVANKSPVPPSYGEGARYIPSTNADTTALAVVISGLPVLETNQFAILIDTSDSMFPMNTWTDHEMFVVGEFGGFMNGTSPMANLNPKDPFANQMVDLLNGIGYIVITVTNSLRTNANGAYVISFKPANYLDTADGIDSLTNAADAWSVIGALSTGTANLDLTLTNIGGDIQVRGLASPAQSDGILLGSGNKAVGIKINGSVSDWSLQSLGLGEVPAGTKIYIRWENVPLNTNAVPWSPGYADSEWAHFPQGGTVTGNVGWLHTDNTTTWNPLLGRPVLFDTITEEAGVYLTLTTAVAPGFELKIANGVDSWNQGEEVITHAGLIPLPNEYGYSVITFKAEFALTNI